MAKLIIKGTPWYVHLSFIVAMGLAIAGFCTPPTGVIDGSVLTCIGEILGGLTLVEFILNIPNYLEAGIKAKLSHGNTSLEVASDEAEKEEDDVQVD